MKQPLFSRLFPLLLAFALVLGTGALAVYHIPRETSKPVYQQLNDRAATMPVKEFLRIAAIDLNTATQEELMSLPGIGEVLSLRILDYRAAHGFFTSLEELKKVKGIGEKTVHKLKEYLYIGEF